MRPAQKSNRSRGRGNRKSGGGGGNNLNRVYDSAGPEGKVRGTPQQIIDKYVSLARDAQTSGDRVASENFLQHAEHYQRILIQATSAQDQARKEAQEAATDSRDDAQPAPHPGEQPQPSVAEPAGTEIGGMAMIDSGAPEPALIVDAQANGPVAKSDDAPRPNGDGRRRRRKPAAPAASANGDAQAEAETTAPEPAPAPAETAKADPAPQAEEIKPEEVKPAPPAPEAAADG